MVIMNYISILFIFVVLLFTPVANSMVGIGGYAPFAWTTQEDVEGNTNSGTFFPMVSLNTLYPIGYQHLFVPEVGFVYHNKSYDNTNKYTFIFLADVAWPVYNRLVIRYGLSGFWTYISGEGGTIALSNGSSMTSFAVPEKSVTSFNSAIDFGLDFVIDAHFTVRGEFFLFGLLNENARQYSYLFSLNYYL